MDRNGLGTTLAVALTAACAASAMAQPIGGMPAETGGNQNRSWQVHPHSPGVDGYSKKRH